VVAVSSEANIWATDSDPWVGPLEFALTRLGADYLHGVHLDMHVALGLPPLPRSDVRVAYHADSLLAKAPGISREEAWNRAAQIFRELAARGREAITPDIHYDLADAATEKWYAEGRLQTRAERLAVAQHLVGTMRAGGTVTEPEATTLRPRELRAQYAAASAAQHVQHLHEQTRHRLLGTIYTWERDQGQPEQLGRMLLHEFGVQMRDWRRVALTETATNRANGYLAALKLGSSLRWSAAEDACPMCRRLHGQRFTLVEPTDPNRDPLKHLWVGKHPRGHTPVYFHPAIPLHPHCRCRYIHELAVRGEVSPLIEARVQAIIRAATTEA